MAIRRTLVITLIVLVAVGAAVTVLWFRASGDTAASGLSARRVALAAVIACSLTIANLAVRWLRWHYVCRRLGGFVPTNDSVRIYFGTLLGIATPFYVGELSRAFLMGPRYSHNRRVGVTVWFAERGADAVVMAGFLLAALGQWLLLAALVVVCVVACVVGSLFARTPTVRAFFRPVTFLWLAVSTTIAWALPILALAYCIELLSGHGTFGLAARSFTSGVLLGGVSGIPLGIGLAGSASIAVLSDAGVAAATLPLTMLVFRAGTVWFALAVGLVCMLAFGKRLLALLRNRDEDADHFDVIASDYADEIGEHVRDRLLERKIDSMQRVLADRGLSDARGLDIGCGQGWYAVEMARRGFHMSGCDLSAGQIEHAHEHAAAAALELDLRTGSATELPYPDASFDFAYSINVLHHVGDSTAQAAAFAEIARVLKPGGVFFLQEMNTRNVAFRFYMGYVFPLMCDIDEGVEHWIRPDRLPAVAGTSWNGDVQYFTFLPDFTPAAALSRLEGLERRLERSRIRHLSAHYVALMERDAVADGTADAPESVSGGTAAT